MTRFAAALFAVLALAVPAAAETCRASWYGAAHHGRTMANGKPFNMNALTAAHRSWPFGTKVRVTYRGRSVVVTITDRGPYAGGRCIDLSRAAASSIGMLGAGVGTVTLHRID